MNPRLVMLAGPNGAGKTTFYWVNLADAGLPFINADVLQASVGVGAYEAAEAVDAVRTALLARRVSFITETVFSDPDGRKLEFLRQAIDAHYEVELVYIGLASTELAMSRVHHRVASGGHSVPPEKIVERYSRSLENLKRAVAFVPTIRLFDNSAYAEFRLLAVIKNGKVAERTSVPLLDWAREILPR
jgi:predicted ABC-type ATPase